MFRPIYEPRTRAREYCDLAINIYTGCNHGCVYCYAPHVLRKTVEEFRVVEPRPGIVESVAAQLKRTRMTDRKIMLCFTCDPYPANVDTAVTREIIKLLKGSGNHVQILTKGGTDAERDFDLLDEHDSFGVTITCSQDMFLSDNNPEPEAAPPYNRILALRQANCLGIKTWVSCEPVIEPEAVYQLIRQGYYIDLFRIGKMNHMPSEIDWLSFGHECERLCKEYERNYVLKEDLLKLMRVKS